jgi:hypothetical protein
MRGQRWFELDAISFNRSVLRQLMESWILAHLAIEIRHSKLACIGRRHSYRR